MKYKYLAFIICLVLVIPLISALEFDNWKTYDKGRNEITITNAFGLGATLAKYKLTYNTDYCLSDCRAEGEAIIYSSGRLFDSLIFNDLKGKSKEITSHKIMIEVDEVITYPDYTYQEICTPTEKNGTSGSCYQEGTQTGTKTITNKVWQDYNGEILSPGNYKWKIEGKKNPRETIDWIGSAFGEDFVEWEWWNGTYSFKQTLNISNTGGITLQNLTTINASFDTSTLISAGKMRSDCADLEVVYNETNFIIQKQRLIENCNNANTRVVFNLEEDIPDNASTVKYAFYYDASGDDVQQNLEWSDNIFVWKDNLTTDLGGWNAYPTEVGCTATDNSRFTFSSIGLNNTGCSSSAGFGTVVLRNTTFDMSNVEINFRSYDTDNGNFGTALIMNFSNSTVMDSWFHDNTQTLICHQGTFACQNVKSGGPGEQGVSPNNNTDLMNNSRAEIHHSEDTIPTNRGGGAIASQNSDWNNFGLGNHRNNLRFENLLVRSNYVNDPSITFASEETNLSVLTLTSTLSFPGDALNTPNSSLDFQANFTVLNGNFTNSTLFIHHFNGSIFNSNFTTTLGNTTNSSALTLSVIPVADNYNWSYEVCGKNETADLCAISSNRTFSVISLVENSKVFNSSSFETSSESFSLNITTDGLKEISAIFFYDEANQGASTKTGTDASPIFTNTLQVPTVSSKTNKSFYWTVTVGSVDTNSTFSNQTVDPISFTLCNVTNNIPYINYTFKNETISEEDTSATISVTTTHWLGDGSVNKTLTFSNASVNPSYSFCLNPADKILNTINTVNYNNPESQQRIFSLTSTLLNVTNNQKLFLLPTSIGLFSQFQTIDSISNPVPFVLGTITRTLGSSTITVASSLTDSSGFINYFLNPDVTYTATFTKLGLNDNTFVFIPTTNLRLVIMGSSGTQVNGSEISVNTTWQTFPINSSLLNNTDHTFGLNVSGNEDITFISMNISNSSGSQLLFSSNAGTGFISSVLNTGNNTQLIGRFIIQTGDETISFSKLWHIGEIFVGDYSIFRQLSLFTEYNFEDFIKFLIVLAVILGVLIFMSAGEIVETSESKVIVVILLIWAFSIVGWLNNPTVVAETGIAEFSRQYGIAILSTSGGVLFIFRRIFT